MGAAEPIDFFTRLRAAGSVLAGRRWLSGLANLTFGGDRDIYQALGYRKDIAIDHYWSRYLRNPVAARVIEAFPKGSWRGGSLDLIEDPDPKVLTEFEKAWAALDKRLKIKQAFLQADILAGLGQYAVILIGAPGSLSSPLPNPLPPENLLYLTPFSQRDAKVDKYESSTSSPRFGRPATYKFTRLDPSLRNREVEVHWSRCQHISDGLLDDRVHSLPRLERVWNNLDDLEKIVGAGAEAFWLRAHQGYQFDLDKDIEMEPGEETKLSDEVTEFVHGMKRFVRTRGMKLEVLGSDVADFDRNVGSIISLISAGSNIPQRILMGSEQGQLASEQDRVNWAARVQDRRTELCGPLHVEPFVDMLIERKTVPTPKQYEPEWPQIFDLSDEERADVALKMSEVNMKNRRVVVEANEIRGVLGYGPIDESKQQPLPGVIKTTTPATGGRPQPSDSQE